MPGRLSLGLKVLSYGARLGSKVIKGAEGLMGLGQKVQAVKATYDQGKAVVESAQQNYKQGKAAATHFGAAIKKGDVANAMNAVREGQTAVSNSMSTYRDAVKVKDTMQKQAKSLRKNSRPKSKFIT